MRLFRVDYFTEDEIGITKTFSVVGAGSKYYAKKIVRRMNPDIKIEIEKITEVQDKEC